MYINIFRPIDIVFKQILVFYHITTITLKNLNVHFI